MKKLIKQPLSFLEKASGILGINARNLLFVNRYNSHAHKKFADNKLYTKNYLSSRGLGVAKVYTIIKNHKELKTFNPKSLPESFVIKPNRGYGGEGILVIKKYKNKKFVDINGKEYDWKDIYRHIVSILDGKYAISGLSDQAIMEERLVMDEYFRRYTDSGLPDVRIIVFNYVPIIAMLRVPTEESNGKANLHLGAVGVGIDISTGKATYAVYHNKFVKKLPNDEKIRTIQIPSWNDVLLMAAKAQHASQIGFLAVDLAITNNGIKILELNARAGLAVQIANQVLLKARLKKVSDLQVPNPEKGVEVSKTLFSSNIPTEKKEKKEAKPIIGLYERVDILNTQYHDILFKIDAHADQVLLDTSLQNLKSNDNRIEIKIKTKRLTLPFKYADFSQEKFQAVLAGKYLQDFMIDLNLNRELDKNKTSFPKKQDVDEKIIQNIDKKIDRIESHLNIVGTLRPTNLDKEKQEFLRNPVNSPRFFYVQPNADLAQFRRELKALPKEIDHPLAKIFIKKIKELQTKLDILESIDGPELQAISSRLYGKADRVLYDKALRYIHDHPIQTDNSKELNQKIIIKQIENFLKKNKLSKWKIKVTTDRTTDIAVNKNGTIFLREDISFSENRLKAVVAHEICTHIFRLENGSFQKYKIFSKGTADYLTTEEGLAIYNQKQLGIPLGEKDIWPALRTIGVYLADEMSFVELFHYLKENYGLDDETAWITCLKSKRGLIDTDKKIAFTRDTVYFRGYLQVSDYLKQNPDDGLKNLYIGKIGLNDLQYLKPNEYKVKFLPNKEV
ncbi:MAG: tyrosine/phenylalanine carboxypeptidase domain-containing protein [bacterium]